MLRITPKTGMPRGTAVAGRRGADVVVQADSAGITQPMADAIAAAINRIIDPPGGEADGPQPAGA